MVDVVEVNSLRVMCDGGSSTLGHPRVFLTIKKEIREVVCPYCSRRYILKGFDKPSNHENSLKTVQEDSAKRKSPTGN